jgi:hypothetical protein
MRTNAGTAIALTIRMMATTMTSSTSENPEQFRPILLSKTELWPLSDL